MAPAHRLVQFASLLETPGHADARVCRPSELQLDMYAEQSSEHKAG